MAWTSAWHGQVSAPLTSTGSSRRSEEAEYYVHQVRVCMIDRSFDLCFIPQIY